MRKREIYELQLREVSSYLRGSFTKLTLESAARPIHQLETALLHRIRLVLHLVYVRDPCVVCRVEDDTGGARFRSSGTGSTNNR